MFKNNTYLEEQQSSAERSFLSPPSATSNISSFYLVAKTAVLCSTAILAVVDDCAFTKLVELADKIMDRDTDMQAAVVTFSMASAPESISCSLTAIECRLAAYSANET